MYLLGIAFAAAAAFGYTLYYLWYLTWPVVEGEVAGVSSKTFRSSIFPTPPVTFRVVRYRYAFRGQEHYSTRQGLVVKLGFSPNVYTGDKIPVSVCVPMPWLSCPRRPVFEAFVLASIVTLCALSIGLLYPAAHGSTV